MLYHYLFNLLEISSIIPQSMVELGFLICSDAIFMLYASSFRGTEPVHPPHAGITIEVRLSLKASINVFRIAWKINLKSLTYPGVVIIGVCNKNI